MKQVAMTRVMLAELCARAAEYNDLNASCVKVQEGIGQTDGGIASIYFSGQDDQGRDAETYWPLISREERLTELLEYAQSEADYGTFVIMPAPLSVKPLSDEEAVALGCDDEQGVKGRMFMLAVWPDRQGWYEVTPNGAEVTVENESEELKTEKEAQAFLYTRVELTVEVATDVPRTMGLNEKLRRLGFGVEDMGGGFKAMTLSTGPAGCGLKVVVNNDDGQLPEDSGSVCIGLYRHEHSEPLSYEVYPDAEDLARLL